MRMPFVFIDGFYFCSVYYDPFLAAHAATQDPNYRLQVRYFSISINSRADNYSSASDARDRRASYRDTEYSERDF